MKIATFTGDHSASWSNTNKVVYKRKDPLINKQMHYETLKKQ